MSELNSDQLSPIISALVAAGFSEDRAETLAFANASVPLFRDGQMVILDPEFREVATIPIPPVWIGADSPQT